MSFFRAVNFETLEDTSTNKQSNKDDIQQTINNSTTELQIENGYELYDEAMRMYGLKLYKESINKFNELLEIDLFRMDNEMVNNLADINDYFVFSNESSLRENRDDNEEYEIEESSEKIIPDICDFSFSYRSEKLDNLRYLTFRNFAMVLYKYLSTEMDKEMTNQRINWKNFVYFMKTIFIMALKCLSFQDVVSPDMKLLELIINFLVSFKSKKLTRNILETVLVENRFLLNSKYLLPTWKNLISTEIITLNAIHDTDMDVSKVLTKLILKENGANISSNLQGIYSCPKVFQNLNRYINLQKNVGKQKYDEFEEEIEVSFYRWNTLVSKIFDLVPAETCTYNFKKENPDPYSLLGIDESISKVLFKIQDEEKMRAFELQPNLTFMTKEAAESDRKDDTDFISKGVNNTGDGDEAVSTFIGRLELKRKASTEFQEEESNSTNKKRISQRVRNLAEDHQKELQSLEIQSTYLLIFENLLKEINKTPTLETVTFLDPNDMKNIQFTRKFKGLEYCLSDVYDSFTKWDKQLSEQFIGTKKTSSHDFSLNASNDIVEQILDKLFHSLHDSDIENAPKLYNEGYYAFLKRVSITDHVHYQQVRIELLKTLLIDNYNKDSKCLINDFLWPTKMSYIVEFLVLCCQDQLLHTLNPSNAEDLLFGVGVYEMLIEMYLKNLKELNRLKNKSGDLFDNVQSLKEKIEAWNLVFFYSSSALKLSQMSQKTIIRLKWANIFYEKSSMKDDYVSFTEEFQIIQREFDLLGSDFVIGNYNYTEIPPVNSSTLQLLSMKESLLSNKEKDSLCQVLEVLYDSSAVTETATDKTSWYCILAKFVKSMTDPFASMDIWTTVFKSISSKDRLDFQLVDKCFVKILKQLKALFISQEYIANDALHRRLDLLKLLSNLYEIVETYCDFLLKEVVTPRKNSVIGAERSRHDLNIILEIYAIIYSIVNYETLVHNELSKEESFFDKAKSSAKKWKALLVYFSAVVGFSYDRVISENQNTDRDLQITNFLKNQHSLLSAFNCCDYGNSVFLLYAQRTLFGISSPEYSALLQQFLFCNYGFTFNNELETHLTEKNENIDAVDSYLLCTHIMRSYLKEDENLLMKLYLPVTLKNDIESVVMFIPGKQYLTDSNVQANRKNLDTYLSMDLRYEFLIENKSVMNIIETGTEYESIVGTNILLAAAVNFLSLYYTRKQKGLDCTSLLTGVHGSSFNSFDNIIELLKTNIIFNGSVFEAWYLLGECYNILAEYDLNSSGDKLNIQSKKDAISDYQKKAILCFLMSLKLFSNEEEPVKHYSDETLFLLYSKVGISLFCAATVPMEGSAFLLNSKNVIAINEEYYDLTYNDETHKLKNVITFFLTNKYLEVAFVTLKKVKHLELIGDQNLYWFLPVFISICQRQLNKPLDDYLEYILFLCDMSVKLNKNITFAFTNLIQQLFYNIDSFEQDGAIDSNDIIEEQIQKSLVILTHYKDVFKSVDPDVWKLSTSVNLDSLSFNKILIFFCNGLIKDNKNIVGCDYQERLLKCLICKSIGDFEAVMNCLTPIVSIASPVKPLINIQPANLEQPGHFFVCSTIFSKLLLEALIHLDKVFSLPFVFKKLKRGSNRILGSISIYDQYLEVYTQKIQIKYFGLSDINDVEMKEMFFVLDEMNTQTINMDYLKKPKSDKKTELVKETESFSKLIYKYSPEERFMDVLGIFEQKNENPQLYENVSIIMFIRLIAIPYRNSLQLLNKIPDQDELKKYDTRGKKPSELKTMIIDLVSQILKKVETLGELYKPSI